MFDKKNLVLLIGLVFCAAAFLQAQPTITVLDQNQVTVGDVTITWDSLIEVIDYNCGDDLTVNVTWLVDPANSVVEYDDFGLRYACYSPKHQMDPAMGTEPVVSWDPVLPSPDDNLDVTFALCDMHWTRGTDYGIGHFMLRLDVDSDSDGIADTDVGLGVNIYVYDDARNCPGCENITDFVNPCPILEDPGQAYHRHRNQNRNPSTP
ncbi:hypothetical protein ACFLU6_10020 [Acidobacteriota bacterium]